MTRMKKFALCGKAKTEPNDANKCCTCIQNDRNGTVPQKSDASKFLSLKRAKMKDAANNYFHQVGTEGAIDHKAGMIRTV